MSTTFRAGARSLSRRAYFSAPLKIRRRCRTPGVRSAWRRRSRRARNSSRRSTATTLRCCAPSWTRSRHSGLLGKVFILAGVGPLRSAKTAEWMRKNVPGMHVPDSIIARLSGAQDQAREGRNICIELIQAIREIRGISGVHVMAYRQEESVAEIVDRSGILQGRSPWYPERDAPQFPQRTAS